MTVTAVTAEEEKEMVEAAKESQVAEEKEMQFSKSPVSDIINDVWRGQTEAPPSLKSEKKRPIKPKGAAILEAVGAEPQEASMTEAMPQQGITVQLLPEHVIAIFDGLKLLLTKLVTSEPQPLKAIYITSDLIRALEAPVVEQLRLLKVERAG